MRVGFFGGTFDPPHRGHLAVALAAADALRLDCVLLAPVAIQPLKTGLATASFADRLAMVSLLAKHDPRMEPSDLDHPQPHALPNYTVDTLSRLKECLPPASRLFLLLGADSFSDLPRWKEPLRILRLAEIIVASRPDASMLDPIEKIADTEHARHLRARIHILNTVHEDVSATELRARLSAGESCEDWVLPEVLGYIRDHGLYQRNEHSI
ncbi:MAG: nicotinate (nicotinamide) nucleotide adenylyltransferase [Acidobacteriaceae bacterium]|nr:nicotinate (nicotinamide) nucleotide adenylyltransferase [Acidobacteriaceae bacterium]